jgi:hypothetical protein
LGNESKEWLTAALKTFNVLNMNEPKNTQYAFWRYDLFPFVLGAECFDNSKLNREEVFVPSYAGYLKPIKIVSIEKGKEIQANLNNLKQLRADMIQAIEAQMSVKLDKIMKELN